MNVAEPLDNGQNKLSPERKAGLGMLIMVAFLAVGLGVMQIRNTLYAPFALNSEAPSGLSEVVNDVESLRFRDTDRDGLNDYDESFVYHTSRYLADTDGDGKNDHDEVLAGTDALCFGGNDCSGPLANSGYVPVSTTTAALVINGQSSTTVAMPDVQSIVNDPKQLRELLAQSGVDKAALDKISDSDLLQAAQDWLNNAQAPTESATSTGAFVNSAASSSVIKTN
jgi:hypothetical protein